MSSALYLCGGLAPTVAAVPIYPNQEGLALPGPRADRVLQLRDVLVAVQRAHPIIVVS